MTHQDDTSRVDGAWQDVTGPGHETITFNEGTTLDEAASHVVTQAATARLQGHRHEIQRAAQDFHNHSNDVVQNLHGDGDGIDGTVFVDALRQGMAAIFPEVTIAHVVSSMVDAILGSVESHMNAAPVDAQDLRGKAQHTAYQLATAVSSGAEEGYGRAVAQLPEGIGAVFAVHTHLQSSVQRSEEAAGQACDALGLYDPQQYSPYLHIRAALEERFAEAVARLQAEADGRYGTPNQQAIVNATDVPRASEDADVFLEREQEHVGTAAP